MLDAIVSLRNRIQDTVTAHGAEFRKDLTKNVTHLIARNTEGEKYKFATQWGIRIVTVKWFEDSLERGMVLEETLYHPLLPDEQQGAGAWNRSLPTPKPKVTNNENPSNPRPRKLRRIASAKLGDQNEGIWGDIVGTGFDSSDPRPSRESLQRTQSLTKRPSILQESRSFASETTFAEVQEPLQPPPPPPAAVERHEGFLGDCFFFIHGFSTKQVSVHTLGLPFHLLTFQDKRIAGPSLLQRCRAGGLLERVFPTRHTQKGPWPLYYRALQDAPLTGPIHG